MSASRIIWELVAVFGVVTLVLLHLYSSYGHHKATIPQVVVTTGENAAVEASAGNIHQAVAQTLSTSSTPSITIKHLPDPTGPAVQKLPPPRKVEVVERPASKSSLMQEREMDWSDFVLSKHDEPFRGGGSSADLAAQGGWRPDQPLIRCSDEVVRALAVPRLQKNDLDFCKWALSPSGGGVKVGSSWGKLTSHKDQHRFDALNCNAVSEGRNPSCADSWGDESIRSWRAANATVSSMSCEASRPSRLRCNRNSNDDLSCTITNAMLDFSKVRKVNRGAGMTPSKKFDQDFLSADCKNSHDKSLSEAFPFPHLFSSKLAQRRCDVVYNGTLLLYSHDDIRNVGHTMNDIMNVWVMLWLENLARSARSIEMLNVDSFKLGHNFDDQPNRLFHTYLKSLRSILKGTDLAGKTVCVKKLLIQPTPPRFFVWESWFIDLPCSFVGPSTLYQRWNLHVRQAYNLLSVPRPAKMAVLVIVRNEHSNMWGSQRTSRNWLNLDAARQGLQSLLDSQPFSTDFELVVEDLAKLTFRQQIELMTRTALVVGMHGAGISMALHMSLGSPRCCGVLELYPQGEFSPIRGHGNMARKIGLHYDRIDISGEASRHDGAHAPVKELVEKTRGMLVKMTKQPTCVHPQVISDPYLEKA